MAGKSKSRNRNGHRSACSYCGRPHRKGKKNDSCRRGSDKIDEHTKKVRILTDEDIMSFGVRKRTKKGGNSQVAIDRRERAHKRFQAHRKLTDQEKLDKCIERGYPNSREADRLRKRLAA